MISHKLNDFDDLTFSKEEFNPQISMAKLHAYQKQPLVMAVFDHVDRLSKSNRLCNAQQN